MRILHSGTLVASAGGPAMSTYLTLKGLREQGVDAEIIMFPLNNEDKLRGDDVPMHFATSTPKTPLGFAPTYNRDILSLGDYDIYHAQGVRLWNTGQCSPQCWQTIPYYTARHALSTGYS